LTTPPLRCLPRCARRGRGVALAAAQHERAAQGERPAHPAARQPCPL